jgi:hypothetical protein
MAPYSSWTRVATKRQAGADFHSATGMGSPARVGGRTNRRYGGRYQSSRVLDGLPARATDISRETKNSDEVVPDGDSGQEPQLGAWTAKDRVLAAVNDRGRGLVLPPQGERRPSKMEYTSMNARLARSSIRLEVGRSKR